MRVINRNVGTPMLSHYCPNCKCEVFNDSKVVFDTDRCCGVKHCEECGAELEFPNTGALIQLLGL